MYVCVNLFMHVWFFLDFYEVYINISLSAYAYVYACVYECAYACVCVCVYVYACVYVLKRGNANAVRASKRASARKEKIGLACCIHNEWQLQVYS